MGVEGIGYNEEGNKVDNELVDLNNQEEQDIIDEINKSLDENDKIAEHALEKLNSKQLSAFLTKNYFEGGVKSYAKCRETGKFLNFSMKAALQLLSKNDTNKYDNNGNLSEEGKSIDDIIKERGGIDLDNDTMLVKLLQKKVGAYPDGKPGPQTIALVISALGGDVSNIYEGVNNLYADNEKFKIQNIAEFTIGEKNYKYDQNQFNLTNVGGKIILTVKGEQNGKEVSIVDGKPTLEGFSFENGWIKLNSLSKSIINDNVVDSYEGNISPSKELYEVIHQKMESADLTIPNLQGDNLISINSHTTPVYTDYGVYDKYDYSKIDLTVGSSKYTFDLKNVLDKEGNFNNNNWLNVLSIAKDELRKKILATSFAPEIRGKSYSINDLFNQSSDGINDLAWGKLNKYFCFFKDKKVKIDQRIKYTYAKDDKIIFDLDNIGRDKKYNKGLQLEATKIDDGTGKMSEEKLKNELKLLIFGILDNID